MTSRRSFLIGLGSALAAPAVIRTAGLLMPVRKVIEPEPADLFSLMQMHYDRMVNPPLVMSEIIDLPFAIQAGVISYAGHGVFEARELVAADWPSRTIKAPPKVARA